MAVSSYLTFEADLPDDSDEESGLPGGRQLMAGIQDAAKSHFDSCGDVEQRSFYGWEFEVGHRGQRYLVVLQYPEPWLLIVDPQKGILKRLFGRGDTEAHQEVVDVIAQVLAGQTAVSNVTRQTEREFSGV